MPSRTPSAIEESQFVELPDDQLLELLGYLHESVKNVDDRLKADEKLQQMEEEIKEYKKLTYTDDQKLFKARLKAVRALAKARGLKFKLPGDDL